MFKLNADLFKIVTEEKKKWYGRVRNSQCTNSPDTLTTHSLYSLQASCTRYSIQRIGLGLIANPRRGLTMGKKSMPKIVINNTIIIKTAIGILRISNHNSFRVLSDKIASV